MGDFAEDALEYQGCPEDGHWPVDEEPRTPLRAAVAAQAGPEPRKILMDNGGSVKLPAPAPAQPPEEKPMRDSAGYPVKAPIESQSDAEPELTDKPDPAQVAALVEAARDARQLVQAVHAHRAHRDMEGGDLPFNTCDYYGMEDIMQRLDAALRPFTSGEQRGETP